MQLLFLPAVCAVIGLLILVTVRTGIARWGWQDMSVGLAVVFAFYVVSIFFSAVGFAGDEMLFPITAALASLGFLMIQRLGPAVAPSAHLAEKQLIYLIVALALMTGIAVGMKRQHLRLLRDYKYSWALVGIALTAAVMVFGVEINGARLWFNLKFFYFQPAEMLKIILVIFFAAYLSDKRELLNAPYAIGRVRLPPLPYMLPMIALWGLSLMIVVVEKDLGQGLLIFGVFLAMLYLANGKISYVIGGLIAFAIGAYVLYRIFPHVQVRVQIWLDPWSRGQGTGAQLVQSQYALASGGIFGSGLGLGDPTNIPLVQTDFVFSAIGEELGLLGTMALLVFYLFFVYRGDAHRARCGGRLQPLSRGGADGGARLAGVHHHRRDGGVIPAHGHHAAVHLVRRELAAVELHYRRHVARDLGDASGPGRCDSGGTDMTRGTRAMVRFVAALAVAGIVAIGIIAKNDHIWLLCMGATLPFLAVALWRGARPDEPLFNRTAQKVAHILLALFILLSMQLVRTQVVNSGATQVRTEQTPLGAVRNPRLLDAQLTALRGEIYSSDGVKIVGREVQPDKSGAAHLSGPRRGLSRRLLQPGPLRHEQSGVGL